MELEMVMEAWEALLKEELKRSISEDEREMLNLTLEDVVKGLKEFLQYPPKNLFILTEDEKQKSYVLAEMIYLRNSYRGIKVYQTQKKIYLLKYALLHKWSERNIISEDDSLKINIFFDYLMYAYSRNHMIYSQDKVRRFASPLPETESKEKLIQEALGKAVNIFRCEKAAIILIKQKRIDMEAHWQNKVIDFKISKEEWDKNWVFQNVIQNHNQLSIPIKLEETLQGFIVVEWENRMKFYSDEFEMLKILADQIAVSLKTYDLYKELECSYKTTSTINNELQQAKEKLEEMNSKLLFVDKNKSDFIANLSHELRTPLNSILAFSNYLLEEKSENLNSTQIMDIQFIHENGEYLLSLINDLLDLSKIEAGKMNLYLEKIYSQDVLLECKKVLEALLNGKNIEIKVDLLDHSPIIYVDEVRVKQIMWNIIGNAIKFTSQGIILIGSKVSEDGNYIIFYVQDTGIGIQKEEQSKVFDRFKKIESNESPNISGTGLGLTISKELVHLMGGEIWFSSEYLKGTTFYIQFPIYKNNE